MVGIGQSASRTVVNEEMMLRRLKLSIYEVVTPREGGGGGILHVLDKHRSYGFAHTAPGFSIILQKNVIS
jgi:hypothetical protein